MRPSWLALKLAVVSVNRQCHLALMNVFAARQAASQIPPAVGLSLHFVAGPGGSPPGRFMIRRNALKSALWQRSAQKAAVSTVENFSAS